ncbi:MAG: Sodium:proton antiporter [Pseudoclavibacter caeni]|jgi:multicomponent Na+:H+ antiporter subunit F
MPMWLVAVLVVVYTTAGGLSLLRIIRGPSVLDRVVASDVLVATLMCALGTEMAVTGHVWAMPILLVLAMFGVVGSFAVARFLATARDPLRDGDGPAGPDPAVPAGPDGERRRP